MSKPKALVVATLTALATLSFSGPAQADQYAEQLFAEDSVSAGAMFIDALAVRPLMLGMTGIGAVLFVASAPFAFAGDSVGKTWHTLVGVPAENTFIRCLGCTPVESERRAAARKTALAAGAAAEKSAAAP